MFSAPVGFAALKAIFSEYSAGNAAVRPAAKANAAREAPHGDIGNNLFFQCAAAFPR